VFENVTSHDFMLMANVFSRFLITGLYETKVDDIENNNFVDQKLFLDLFRLYCNTKLQSDQANSFIQGFGNKFSTYSP